MAGERNRQPHQEDGPLGSLIGAGFFLLRPTPRPEWESDNVLPREIISASACLCPRSDVELPTAPSDLVGYAVESH